MKDSANRGTNLDDQALENEFVWALRPFARKLAILLSCWTIPLQPNVDTFTKDDGVKARALALFLIAALTFAVRGEDAGPNHTKVFTAFAGGVAIILSALLNLISRKTPIREKLIISAYASTIVVMFLFVCVQQLLILMPVFDLDILQLPLGGDIVVPAVLAGLIALAILLAKSGWWDRHKIGGHGIKHAIRLIGGSTIIVIIVGLMKPGVFRWFQLGAEWIAKFRPQ